MREQPTARVEQDVAEIRGGKPRAARLGLTRDGYVRKLLERELACGHPPVRRVAVSFRELSAVRAAVITRLAALHELEEDELRTLVARADRAGAERAARLATHGARHISIGDTDGH